MATIYEGTQREQDLVDERIDPEILRALGLEDVSDLDYSEYKTLLKERLVQNRMNTDQGAREDSAELDEKILNEFKRVKSETGRFRVKNDRVSFQKMLPGSGGGGALTTNITPVTPPEEEQTVEPPQEQGLNEFLSGVVAPSLTRIESSLLAILENLTGQEKAEEKAAGQARISGEKAKKREKENRFEGLGDMAKKAAGIAKKVMSPLADIFSKIFNFLSNVLTGFLVLKVLDWIKDPRKLFIDIGNMFIMLTNTILRVIFDILFLPVNALTDGLNSGLTMFEDAINNTIGKIPGIPKLDLPDIPKVEYPEIPLIPYPKEERKEPKKQEKAPNVPAMSEGGQVRGNTGERVSGAGPDTQLVALQPGEFVMSKGAVDTFGVDTMMNMNAEGGGTNTPKMAKVHSVGDVQAMQGGGMVGDEPPQRASFPTGRQGAKSYQEALKRYKVQITQVEPQETIDGKPPKTPPKKGQYGSAHLKAYAIKNGITDPTELAMFMAQMSHESGSFRHDTEIASGEDYETGTATGKVLGNTEPGDGPRFKGRGYIQLTGRWNYGHFGKKVGVDLISNPELAADPDIAAAIAVQFYKDRVDREAARRGDVEGATRGINPGLNGLKDRQRRFDIYMSGGTPEGDVKGMPSEGDVSDLKSMSSQAPQAPQSPQAPQQTQQQSLRPGTPETTMDFEKPEYESGGLPIITPKFDNPVATMFDGDKPIAIDSPPKKAPPPPPVVRSSGGGDGKVPVLAAQSPQVPTSSSSDSGGSTAPMFSPLDTTNPELIVVKAIYNIVG